MILNVMIEKEIPPHEVEGLTLAVFSDMQIDVRWSGLEDIKGKTDITMDNINTMDNMNTMFEVIEEMYKEAGLRSKFKTPYNTPHILFWNLQKTNGFPSKTSQKI